MELVVLIGLQGSGNPVTGAKVLATRRRVRRELELPMKDAYSSFIANLLPAPAEATP